MFSCPRTSNLNFFLIDEEHGFKDSANKQTALNGEFYFYSQILGFQAADEGIDVVNNAFSFVFITNPTCKIAGKQYWWMYA